MQIGFDDRVSGEQPSLRLIENGSVCVVSQRLEDRLGNVAESIHAGATAPTGKLTA
ncbi:MAG TPA: hypothetical protein VFZ09_04765 [Archangium sp.]|uniref:hypothetical protein n=1 Tax=Archangium sp. TaxID=1872627 RepID=UPI002E3207E1|nr:hypothetical protein [Archangium sp.]HEX5745534.1 hypothetical protein [Archangium sp.]